MKTLPYLFFDRHINTTFLTVKLITKILVSLKFSTPNFGGT